jgi:hypothetical protein
MKRLSGYVFDTYDDVDGQVLRSLVENPSTLPPFVKTAARLTPAQVGSLSDDHFALILFDGTDKLKKFATVDKGNTTLSVLYLLKQAHLLPPDAVKTAARNLIGALQMHGLSVPDELEKAAKSGASSVSGKTQSPYAKGSKVNKLQYPEILEEPKESHDNPQLGKTDAAWDDVKERTNVEGSPGTNFMEVPAFSQTEKTKTASDGQRWEDSRRGQSWDYSQLFGSGSQVKQQSWRESPYFDISGWDPSMATTDLAPPPERTLLEGSYPIDGYDQVKTASEYFDTNWKQLPHRERHQYCVKLASRMSELGMEVPEAIARYGSTTYAADVDSYVEARRSYVHEESHEVLDLLLEKRAQVSPGVFAESLAEFDRMNDLNWHWDSKITDPWYSTFGPSLEKIADANWRYDKDGTRCSEDDLENLARNGYPRLCKTFGHDFAKEFAKSPKTFFEALPAPNKLILARLASDRHAGTFTE